MPNLSGIYVSDFETTINNGFANIWLGGFCSVEDQSIHYFYSIDEFMHLLEIDKEIKKLYFHNAKFDCSYIFDYILRNGWEYSENKSLCDKQFSTVYTDTNIFYQLKLCFDERIVTIYDSYKMIPSSLSNIAKDYDLSVLKGEIDYNKNRPIGYQPTNDEIKYLDHDLLILAEIIKILYNNKDTKMTSSANALDKFKKIIGKTNFECNFPVLADHVDVFIRQSYKGGWTYCNKLFQNKIIGSGLVFDVNSLYPSVMYNKLLPFGIPIHYFGKYENDNKYPLFVQKFRCQFELKEGFLPTIQLKNNLSFIQTQYLESSKNKIISLCLTSVDLELFFKHYNVYNLTYDEGYKFMALHGMFSKYIDFYMYEKINYEGARKNLAKLKLNGLYGKFGKNGKMKNKKPILENNKVKWIPLPDRQEEGIYIPIATFVTSYAREIAISTAQANIERFVYCDTDSIHLIGTDKPDIYVHKSELGAWKLEYEFDSAIYLRAKSYFDNLNKKYHYYDDDKKLITSVIRCAGMPDSVKKETVFEDFKKGYKSNKKLRQKTIPGGIILENTTFEIK